MSIVASLGVLFIFKYFNFFADSVTQMLEQFGMTYLIPHLNILLPVGISFYTFQAMSYTLDVYRGQMAAERHFGIFATYIAFFPQLVAGPIERAKNLLPQFRTVAIIDYDRITSGLKRVAWGVFKKVVIADRVAIVVNTVYANPSSFDGPQLILATLAFSIQIYCDFSAYSDIAIGTAKVFGFDLMENFRQPYFSHSVLEFWRRWHISLSSWIRDYLFMPLSRTLLRRSKGKHARRTEITVYIVVMGLVGLWHGASWTFVFWGFLIGVFMSFEIIFRKPLREMSTHRLGKIMRWVMTFTLINIAWVFFRANSMQDAFYILTHLFDGMGLYFSNLFSYTFLHDKLMVLGLFSTQVVVLLFSILIMFAFEYVQANASSLIGRFRTLPVSVRWAIYYFGIFWILIFGAFGQSQFIYFQF